MLWRRWFQVCCVLVAASLVTGCGKKNPHGWIEFNVPPAQIPAGWTTFKDGPSGVSLAAPPGWISWTGENNAKVNAMADAARHAPPGTTHAGVGTLTSGIQPTLFLVDTSDASLKRMAFSYISVAHQNGGGPLNLDGAEKYFREHSSDPLERVDLPIGPALKQTAERVAPFGNGQSTNISSVMFSFVRESDQYVIRFTAESEQFAALAPIIDQVMATVRVGPPDPNAVVQTPPLALTSGVGGPGPMPGQPGYSAPQVENSQPEASPPVDVPDNQTAPPGPAPDASSGAPQEGSPPDGSPQSNPQSSEPSSPNQPGPDQGQPPGPGDPSGSTGGG